MVKPIRKPDSIISGKKLEKYVYDYLKSLKNPTIKMNEEKMEHLRVIIMRSDPFEHLIK